MGRYPSKLCEVSTRSKICVRLVLGAAFFIACIHEASAQSAYQPGAGPQQSTIGAGGPPPDVTMSRLPARDPNAIAVDGWLLYPTLRVYSLYSDNLFLSPIDPISAPGFGITPSMAAVWSNGIHTTTLYGNLDRQVYPTNSDVNTIDGRAGFTQKYEAMRDLIFSFNGNYVHQTWSTGLQNSIQTPSAAPTTTALPNGETVLPNGTIISSSGQTVGQANNFSGSTVPLQINPSNQYTGTFTIDKILNRAALSISGSLNRTDYENQSAQPSFNSRTLTENASVWLGPLIYAYSTGSISTVVTDATSSVATASTTPSFMPSTSTTSYRVVGGLGTRPSELFRGSVYFGEQGSSGDGSTAGGNVYGGALSYYPTADLTFTGTIDETINLASNVALQSSTTNLALTLPGVSAVQVPIGESTKITSLGLQSNYRISQQWFVNCLLAYSRIEFVDGPRLDNSWVFDATLRYDIWRNLSLQWEYRYTTILSNAPLASASSNFGIISAMYRF